MTLHFTINYRTAWGQTVEAELYFLSADGKSQIRRIALDTTDGEHWQGRINLRAHTGSFGYTYIITAGKTELRREWEVVPRIFPADDKRNYYMADHWRDVPEASHCYTDAYLATTGLKPLPTPSFALFPRTILFRVQAPQIKAGQHVALLGDQLSLGHWDPKRAIPMSPGSHHEWTLAVSAESLIVPFQYKYVIIGDDNPGEITWEGGENRVSPVIPTEAHVVALSDDVLRMPLPHWKVAGLVVPLFSLRSEGSQGIGDFGDLKAAADWAAGTGMHAIQLLPIYDTTQTRQPTDSYPYNAISVHALHPIYIDIRQLPALSDEKKMASYRQQWEMLNAQPSLDYTSVIRMKEDYLHELYAEQKDACLTADYRQFASDNAEWLLPYSVFCLLRDTYGTCRFPDWKELSCFNTTVVKQFAARHDVEVGFYTFVQYLLDIQLREAAKYARQKGIFLKGDLPIGISPCSVEAWQDPHLFHMDGQAGAPPDDFSAEGQNWGFPTYDWEQMAVDGYLWWRQRLSGMARYFSAYRIDHILGFFRIWQVPGHSVTALLGQFSPALPYSIGEIGSFGLRFHADLFTRPYITDEVLEELFEAEDIDRVRDTYLLPYGTDQYQLRPEYTTQVQIRDSFRHSGSEHDEKLLHGLYALTSNVLFVPDMKKADHYHPRIGVIGTSVFKSLLRHEQEAFCQLYEQFYFHRHNEFWRDQALEKLPALTGSSDMLVCGEDLGMVPACVTPVMQQLGILSLEIQAMPKTLGQPFGLLHENPYRSVSTIFTHDMPTLRLWWEENPERTQLYYNTVLQHDGKAPATLPGWLCEEIVARHLNCPSMLCLISLQDWLSIDEELRNPDAGAERINIPANPRHYWRYRMHLPLSRLMQASDLNARIRTLIERSER